MSAIADQLKARTMQLALDICKLLKTLPEREPGPTVRRQLARAATGVAFNYRAACRARTHAEFTAKLGIVCEEADETQGWLEFIESAGLTRSEDLPRLMLEATEIVRIMSSAHGTARSNERDRLRNRSSRRS